MLRAYQGRQCSPVRFGSLGGRGLRPRGARYNISTAMNGSCQSLKAADKVVEGCEPCRTGFALSHIGTGTALAAATSAPGLGSPLPHLHQDWAHRCRICAGTGLAPLPTSAQGLGSPLPTSAPGLGLAPSHTGTGTALFAATSAPGLGSPHICAGTGRTGVASAPGLGPPPAHICAGTGRYHGCLQPNP